MWSAAGIIFGPLLFLLYINDLGFIFEKMRPVIFADDTNLIAKENSLDKLEQAINNEIPTLMQWLSTNRLSLNVNKTHVMVFVPNSKRNCNDIKIIIENQEIEIVEKTKFLGIILDKSLSWKQHIAYISTKIAKSVGIISKARKLLNPDILKQLYYSFLYPYLIYCLIVWGSAGDTVTWPIFKLQKRAVRLINNVKRRLSSQPTFRKLKILRFPDLYKFSVMIFMHKYKNDLLPSIFDDFYKKNSSFHAYPTRSANKLRGPKIKTKLATSFIKNSGVVLWNELSPFIDEGCKIAQLKKVLISYFTEKYVLQ
jgi:hypothetical protein